MKTLALCAILACLTTAPFAAFALDGRGAPEALVAASPEPASATTMVAAAASDAGASGDAANARLVFVVRHTGSSAPALLSVDGPAPTLMRAVVLEPGVNTLIDDHLPLGTYRITLQNVATAGGNEVDLRACPLGTLASMNTTFATTRFALSIPPDACLGAEG